MQHQPPANGCHLLLTARQCPRVLVSSFRQTREHRQIASSLRATSWRGSRRGAPIERFSRTVISEKS